MSTVGVDIHLLLSFVFQGSSMGPSIRQWYARWKGIEDENSTEKEYYVQGRNERNEAVIHE